MSCLIVVLFLLCTTKQKDCALGNRTRHTFLNKFTINNHSDTIELFYIVHESFILLYDLNILRLQWFIYHSGFCYSCRLRRSRSSITRESSRSKFIFSNAKISFTRKVLLVSFHFHNIPSCFPYYSISMYLYTLIISQPSCRFSDLCFNPQMA